MTAAPAPLWVLCDPCGVMVRTPHACPASGPTCPTTDPGASGEPCGACADCLALQAASLAGWTHDSHGSPSDLYRPEEGA